MTKPTIYYIVPNIYKPNLNFRDIARSLVNGTIKEHIAKRILIKPRPIGGHKVMYQHCELLEQLGFDAKILLMGSGEGHFYQSTAKETSINKTGFALKKTDVIVCPETTPYLGLRFKECKKLMFVQNSPHLYTNFRTEDSNKGFINLGYDQVLTCSSHLKKMLIREPEPNTHLIPNFIDHEKFTPKPSARQEGKILALPRKNPKDLLKIKQILSLSGIELHLADKIPQHKIIEEFQSSDIFLATGYPEGFGLPPLEAMACGAAVVGFTGGGASEFMIDQETSLVADDGDCDHAAECILSLLKNPELKESIRENGRNMSMHYNANVTRERLEQVFTPIMT